MAKGILKGAIDGIAQEANNSVSKMGLILLIGLSLVVGALGGWFGHIAWVAITTPFIKAADQVEKIERSAKDAKDTVTKPFEYVIDKVGGAFNSKAEKQPAEPPQKASPAPATPTAPTTAPATDEKPCGWNPACHGKKLLGKQG